MIDYIDRKALLDSIRTDTAPFNIAMVFRHIHNIPAADVVEVRHGRWIKPVPGDGEPYCSECHVEQPWFYGYGYYHRDYCPNCGALMDGREADREV